MNMLVQVQLYIDYICVVWVKNINYMNAILYTSDHT